MKTINVIFLFIALLLTACSKDETPNSGPNSYPKQVSVTYKISSISTSIIESIEYANETGGSNQLSNISLPYSKVINRTVNGGDLIYLDYYHNDNSNPPPTVTLEILVDNAVVVTKTYTHTSGSVYYTFE